MAEFLQSLAARLAIPGLPEWVGLVALVALGLTLLAFLAMPFSVFGVKARLEQIEAQLDEIHTELRALVLRQGEGALRRKAPGEEDWVEPPQTRRQAPEPMVTREKPPVPPPPAWVHDLRPPRVEPRLDPPREGKR